MELIAHLVEHALEDTLYLIPFLFATYLLLEVLEHKIWDKAAVAIRKAGVAGPFVGALLGAVPQCGFSAAGSALFSSRAITLGTLFAIFLSTSDEMLPIFIAERVDLVVIASIIGIKIVIGMIMGFAIDGFLRLRLHSALKKQGVSESHDHVHEHEHAALDETFSHHHCHNSSCTVSETTNTWKNVIFSATKHTLQVTAIIFLISLALVAVMETAGEEALAQFLTMNPSIAIFVSALVGLIPNCGASVVITQLYLDGMLGTGAMISGLLVSAGIGLLVLFAENHSAKQNVAILVGLFATGVAWGLAIEAIGIAFI